MSRQHSFRGRFHGRFYCECRGSFTRMSSLRIHIRACAGEKPYICGFGNCRKAFSRRSDMLTHKKIHSPEKRHTCGQDGDGWGCGRSFRHLSHIYRHLNTCREAPYGARQVVRMRNIQWHYA
ncbi:hypothetical protein F5X98DRAFT_104248 [Xylaria grammica]|nr:hypothetical protein F5X98DRAFT_104248 [Xylaria grammica]